MVSNFIVLHNLQVPISSHTDNNLHIPISCIGPLSLLEHLRVTTHILCHHVSESNCYLVMHRHKSSDPTFICRCVVNEASTHTYHLLPLHQQQHVLSCCLIHLGRNDEFNVLLPLRFCISFKPQDISCVHRMHNVGPWSSSSIPSWSHSSSHFQIWEHLLLMILFFSGFCIIARSSAIVAHKIHPNFMIG